MFLSQHADNLVVRMGEEGNRRRESGQTAPVTWCFSFLNHLLDAYKLVAGVYSERRIYTEKKASGTQLL